MLGLFTTTCRDVVVMTCFVLTINIDSTHHVGGVHGTQGQSEIQSGNRQLMMQVDSWTLYGLTPTPLDRGGGGGSSIQPAV